MILNKNYFCFYFLLFILSYSFSQESKTIEKDSTKIEKLDEVVVTGQINPQSVDQSVYEVKVIGRREIEKRAGVNLADLLNQTLNINITPNLATGRSGFEIFGLDGEYVKVLIDNVPLVNENGYGNGADLTLINLDDVERIEIVEGSMGVQYGANAIAAVINIITKKSSKYKTEVSVYLQEETLGSEYALFDEGRHIQSFSATHYFNDKLFVRVGALRNDFAGLFGDRLGESHAENDSLRGHIWLPKTQINPSLMVNYDNDEDFSVYYRFEYFNEGINRYNNAVNLNPDSATDTNNPTAQDEEFTNNRFIHTVNAMGKIDKTLSYNIIASYQSQKNNRESYTYVIRDDDRQNIENEEVLSRSAFFTRATLGNIFKSDKFNLQAGYEMNVEQGFSDSSILDIIESTDDQEERLNNYGAFLSSEYKFSNRFMIKPGFRTEFTNIFGPQFLVSLSSSYKFNNDYELRAVIGSANKTPTFDELFTNFVDSNHNFTGNPNLDPERGYSVFTHLKKTFKFNDNLRLKSKLSFAYIDLEDRIEFVQISFSPNVSTFLNIDEFRSVTANFENEFNYKKLSARLGLALQGQSKVLNAETGSDDGYLTNFSANFNVNYGIPKWKSNVTLYYKYRGRVQQFLSDINDNGEQFFRIGETEAFSWLDLNFEKSFSDGQFVATLGARNLLDIDFTDTNALPGGAHSEAPVAIPLAYGRSFFLKLNYIFKQ